jgi:hypothetical protein
MNNATISPPLCGEELTQLSTGVIVSVLDYNLSTVFLRAGRRGFFNVPLATFWQRYARTK